MSLNVVKKDQLQYSEFRNAVVHHCVLINVRFNCSNTIELKLMTSKNSITMSTKRLCAF